MNDFLTLSKNYKIGDIIFNDLSGFGTISEISLEDEFLGIKYFKEDCIVEEDFDTISKVLNSSLDKIKDFASAKHNEFGCKYDNKPYTTHLENTAAIAYKFLHLVPEYYHITVIKSCWCHDLLEDTNLTFEQLEQVTNKDVANICNALKTKDGTRKERFNEEYYNGIKNIEFGTFVKLCDRISNVLYSIKTENTKKIKMYEKENFDFYSKLYDFEYGVMFNYLDQLFANKEYHKEYNLLIRI